MMQSVLIANRGEIALRVIRACRAMGIRPIAVYSEADREAPHVAAADVAIAIGPAAASASYLNIAAILDAAARTGAEAIHPGYGFLSENADFAEACAAAGPIFIGPPAEVIRRMGSKTAAREAARLAGVPAVPGAVPRSQSHADLRAAALDVGFPVLLKASAGGGGKGMRAVSEMSALDDAVDATKREAMRAFGDDALYLERAIRCPRHVEVQVFGDAAGNVIHLWERDCTLQRRHQKVIEEAPAVLVHPDVRARLRDAAVRVARSVGYVNAGTVEFLVAGTGAAAEFFFLEMNTRLQVEHPVTEAITGLDLVQWQLRVASGEPLPLRQTDVPCDGHAVECRVYAEDPRRLLPQSGRLVRYREPTGGLLRIDSGVVEGQTVGVHYDALLAKLTTHGDSRDEAFDAAAAALRQYEILGLRHNIPLLHALATSADVRHGDTHTRYIEDNLTALVPPVSPALTRVGAAVAARVAGAEPERVPGRDARLSHDPWSSLGPISW